MYPQNLTLIPVTEKMPDEDQDVIAWTGKCLVAAKYNRGEFQTEKYPSSMDRSIVTYWVGITHWMPAKY